MKVLFQKIDENAVIPTRAHPTDAGMDLYSVENVIIPPNESRVVSTGLKIAITPNEVFSLESRIFSEGYESCDNFITNNRAGLMKNGHNSKLWAGRDFFVWQAEVRPRSGLAAKHCVTVANSPGTIDTAYRGPLKVIMINHNNVPFTVNVGDRIAQLLFTKSFLLPIQEVSEFLDETERGEGGFGSTGA